VSLEQIRKKIKVERLKRYLDDGKKIQMIDIEKNSICRQRRMTRLKKSVLNGNLQIVEAEKLFHEMSFYFIVAKKIE
jgi:hypothetical protein